MTCPAALRAGRVCLLGLALVLLAACGTPPATTAPAPALTTAAPRPTTAPPQVTAPPAAATLTPTPTPTRTRLPATATRPATATAVLSPTPFTAANFLFETDYPLWSVAWSPDGRLLAAGGEAGRMTLWDPATEKRVRNLWLHSGFVESLTFSPDSRRLASGSADGTIIVWEAATGRSLKRLEGDSTYVWMVAWSPDGSRLGVNRAPDPAVVVWDATTWQVEHILDYPERLFEVAWSPDGSQLATGTTGDNIVFWDAQTGQVGRELSGHTDNVLTLAWSPDGRWLASRSLDNQLFIWDVVTGQRVHTHSAGRGLFSLAWSPDSRKLAYGSLSGPVTILDVTTGGYLFALNTASALRDLAWSPDGAKLAAATGDGVQVWTIGPELVPSPTPIPTRGAPATASPATPTAAATVISGDGRPMVFVPGGPFLMGAPESDAAADPDERPQHSVSVDAFWIDQYEVSHTDYFACVALGACPLPAEKDVNGFAYKYAAQIPTGAVVNVTWDAANAYCAWAGKRLPTEAEWEKAAHGETWRLYPWGDGAPRGKAWFCDNCLYDPAHPEALDDFSRPAPVDAFPEGGSPYGAANLAGNVWEWVADWYGPGTYAAPDQVNPAGPATGEFRVIRGGSWTSQPEDLRTTYRNAWRPDTAWIDVGFRCAQAGE